MSWAETASWRETLAKSAYSTSAAVMISSFWNGRSGALVVGVGVSPRQPATARRAAD